MNVKLNVHEELYLFVKSKQDMPNHAHNLGCLERHLHKHCVRELKWTPLRRQPRFRQRHLWKSIVRKQRAASPIV